MISFESKGSFQKTEAYLNRIRSGEIYKVLGQFGAKGCAALEAATPRGTGLAASSWSSRVYRKGNVWEIVWYNGDDENGFPVAIMLQYGYTTGTGGYVRGKNYINPAIKPIFDNIASSVWKEVTRP